MIISNNFYRNVLYSFEWSVVKHSKYRFKLVSVARGFFETTNSYDEGVAYICVLFYIVKYCLNYNCIILFLYLV